MSTKYRLVKENKDDHLKAVLETDVVNTFTIEEADARNEEYVKKRREAEAQIRLCRATLTNIEKNHPKVVKLSAVQRNAARMYAENEEMVKDLEPYIKALTAAINNHVIMRKEVYDQFNWVDELPEENESEVTIDLNKVRGGKKSDGAAKGAKKA